MQNQKRGPIRNKQSSPGKATTILTKNKAEGITLSNIKAGYRTTIIKTEGEIHKSREHNLEPRNRPTQKRLTDWQRYKKHSVEEGLIFSTNGARTSGYPWAKKMNIDLNFTPHTKIYSGWIMDLNVNCKTFTLLGKKNEKSLGSRASIITKGMIHKRKDWSFEPYQN